MSAQDSGNLNSRPGHAETEISLVDLVRVLFRHKFWLITPVVLGLAGALAVIVLQERHYTFTTSVLIGEFGLDKYVAQAKGVKSVLDNRIVPVVERRFVDERGLDNVPFRTVVRADEGNNFVNVQSQAPADGGSLIAEFHGAIAEALTADHSSKLDLLERESRIKLENLRAALETQEVQLKNLQVLLAQLPQPTADSQDGSAVESSAQGAGAGMEATLTSSNTTLTLLLGQLQLSEQLSKRESRVNELEGLLQEEELKRSWIKPTRVVNLATRSVEQAGKGAGLILAFGAAIGLMLGVFAAFAVELVRRVKAGNSTQRL